MMLKNYEGVRQQKALEYRERVASFQVRKKIILRKTGQELFLLLRDMERKPSRAPAARASGTETKATSC